jgi:hypothetical protein
MTRRDRFEAQSRNATGRTSTPGGAANQVNRRLNMTEDHLQHYACKGRETGCLIDLPGHDQDGLSRWITSNSAIEDTPQSQKHVAVFAIEGYAMSSL